jgi:hypothetical protein
MSTTNKGLNQPVNNSSSWDVPLNANFGYIDTALAGTQIINVAGLSGTITLSALDYVGSYPANAASTQPLILFVTGSPIADITLSIPAGVGGQWIVDNATGAGFNLYIGSAGGGSSVLCLQGYATHVTSTGTNMAIANQIVVGTGLTAAGNAIALTHPVSTANGGTGVSTTPTNGQLLIGNGSGYSVANLTAGANVTITNSAGGISIASTGGGGGGGGVTSVGLASSMSGMTISSNTTNPVTTTGTLTIAGTLNPSAGGTGAASLTGYLYGNGASAATASTTIPTTALSGSVTPAHGGTGATALTGYVYGNNTATMTASTTIPNTSITGLGTMSTQAANNVSITGGSITNLSALGVYNAGSTSFLGIQGNGGPQGFLVGGPSFVTLEFAGTSSTIYGNASQVTAGPISGSNYYEWTIDTAGHFSLTSQITQASAYGFTAWTNISDEKTKKNVEDYSLSVDAVKMLRPVSYQYNGKAGSADNGLTHVGFVAQEVERTPFSAMVGIRPKKHRDDPNDADEYKTLNTSELVFALVNCIKELDGRIRKLESHYGDIQCEA